MTKQTKQDIQFIRNVMWIARSFLLITLVISWCYFFMFENKTVKVVGTIAVHLTAIIGGIILELLSAKAIKKLKKR